MKVGSDKYNYYESVLYPNFLLKINISNAILGCICITKYVIPLRAARANPSAVVLAHPQLRDFMEQYENKIKILTVNV